jgi:hypothetical protein
MSLSKLIFGGEYESSAKFSSENRRTLSKIPPEVQKLDRGTEGVHGSAMSNLPILLLAQG